jgi:pimeloyl-ACP methyl ester carboxylesterase
VPTECAEILVDDPDFGDLVLDAVVAGADDGEPVLLLHGWPQTTLSWAHVIPPLASSGYRVAAVDQRGYSPRARPVEVAAYSIDRLVADAVGILDSLGWASAHVVGHDWGAAVGWNLAAQRPGLVRSLTALSVPHPKALQEAFRANDGQREMSEYMTFFRTAPETAAKVLLREDASALRAVYGEHVHARDVAAYVEHFAEDAALEASLRWYAAMGHGSDAGTPDVAVPTTFVWGSDDIAIGETAALACAAHSTGANEFRPLPGRSHWLPDEDPDAVVDAILARAV